MGCSITNVKKKRNLSRVDRPFGYYMIESTNATLFSVFLTAFVQSTWQCIVFMLACFHLQNQSNDPKLNIVPF